MIMQQVNILALLFGLCTGTAIDRNNFTDDICTYTFDIPRAYAPSGLGGDANDNAALKALITNQHELLEQQLNTITERLMHFENGMISKSTAEEIPSHDGSIVGGSIYTQWGRASCPDTSNVIYQGYAGKSYSGNGGGVNFLCLPKDPEFPEGVSSGHQSKSYIYGTEYEKENSPLIAQSIDENDVPCAVCEVNVRTRQLMIPAKMTCPTGWTYEYDGLLMAQKYDQNASDFICVANDMEVVNGGSSSTNAALLYVVEAVCGALKCPPYTNGYEIACVVCTK